MTDLTIDEKTNFAALRAREDEAEKHYYDLAQPFFPLGFSVGYRNPGHWDIYAQQCPGKVAAWKYAHPQGQTTATDKTSERAFRIRGVPGEVIVLDERWNPYSSHPRTSMKFKSITGAMLWIVEELMQEPT